MDRWTNQEEALQFALSHPYSMMDMEMGTGKTRVALDAAFSRQDVKKVLIVCPKAVIGVWRQNLNKFEYEVPWECWDVKKGTVKSKAASLRAFLNSSMSDKIFAVINYDSVWRAEMGDYIYKWAGFDMVILDESHRAKAAGSKVSKYLGMLGKTIKYKMCLSGTPMANSPLDVYGQYRFLDPRIFGTRYDLFEQQYAIKGGPDLKFVVGYKNQKDLQAKFASIAYTCKMSDIKDRIKLPDHLPPVTRYVNLPPADMKVIKDLNKEFIAEVGSGHIVVNNVLVKMVRLQQICSGYCITKNVFGEEDVKDMNTSKEEELLDILSDISVNESVVVFCQFRHDLEAINRVALKANRKYYELSGALNTLNEWQADTGGVIGVQIQAGAEGVDMTKSHYAIYYSLPHSLALYSQSKARLYRPGQSNQVVFMHILAEGTIDEAMYKSLQNKSDIVESIKMGTFDFGYMK